MLDLSWCSGLTEARKIAGMAKHYYAQRSLTGFIFRSLKNPISVISHWTDLARLSRESACQ